jgi:predicted DCC family thiol-disulfide oxidoreductase YuxK
MPRAQNAVGLSHDIVFYDGECGLCHGFVRFILPRDKAGIFRYAPLQGETFDQTVSPAQRAALPDSVAVRTASGELLTRSAAAIHVLRSLSVFYRLVATVLWLAPKPLGDWLYDFIARRRKGWFAKPPSLCPIVPEHLRTRFLP